jgi:hypothetical protein
MNGTADPGMYPDCAEHVGLIDRGREDELAREAAQLEDAQRESLEREAEPPPTLATTSSVALAPLITEQIPPEALDAFVAQIDVERIPPTTIRLREIARAAGALADRLEARWGQETGGLGWREPGTERAWTFRGTSGRKWKDIPALLAELMKEGLSLHTIGAAISEMRVTDLKEAARIFGTDKEKRIVELLEDHRGPHHGIPHFKELED